MDKTTAHKTPVRNIFRGIGLFTVLAAATGYIILREYSAGDLIAACSEARPVWLLAAVLMMGLFFCCEAANIGRGLRLGGCSVKKRRLLFYSLTGFFFSSVTPSASGGQPMQLYVMHRDGIRTAHGLLALLVELASFQTAAVTLAAMGAVIFFDRVCAAGAAGPAGSVGGILWLFAAGTLLNLLILTGLLMVLFSRHMVRLLLAAAFWLLEKTERYFSSCDEAAAKERRQRLLGSAAAWRRAASALRKNPRTAASLLGTSIVQLCGFCAVPWLIGKSLGISALSLPLAMGTQAMLYISVSSLPLPGAVGVTEGGFSVLFAGLIPAQLLGCTLILSRLASFYIPLIISGLGFLSMKKRPD